MKDIFNGIIVVEGKTDVSVLSSFLDAEYVITNGSAIDNDVLNYLLSRSKNTQIVVLTDPDMPGKRIRDIIEAKIPNVSHCFIEKKYAIKKNKVGVAECDINYLKECLNHIITYQEKRINNLSMKDLYELKLTGSGSNDNKNKIASIYHLGRVNSKTLLKRLNGIGVTKEQLKELL
ncbi:MAG: ribonuclease M5 [Bacilli bacterium]|nr:ribonuclease M5 [Bacilli bacterium]